MALTLKKGIRSKYLIFGLFWVRAFGLKREREEKKIRRRRKKEEGRRKKKEKKEKFRYGNFV